MDLQSFLQSGLLEAYVLGQCSVDERREVEQMLAEHPSVLDELAAIEQALEQYAQANAVPPPAGLKERILEAIRLEAERLGPPPVSGVAPGNPRLMYQLALAVLAITVAWLLYNQNKLRTENTALQNEQVALQQRVQDCNTRGELNQKIADHVRNPRTRQIALTDETNPSRQPTFVYYNTASHETVLDMSGLLPSEQNEYLQIWTIVDGKPVSKGMIHWDAEGGWHPITVDLTENPQAFAISEEDNPKGNPAPTKVLIAGGV